MLATINSIEKQFEGNEILSQVSFTIDAGHKIALVGRNGIGKSTLLKIIAGIYESDSGNVVLPKNKTVSYLPQEVALNDTRTGIEYIQESPSGPFKEHTIATMLNGFSLDMETAKRCLQETSGGQRTKILLTRFLLEPADLLLLDEPTNNLDMASIIWLETFLKETKKAMVVVSHDLRFITKITNRVLELTEKGVEYSRGSYTDYLERKEKDIKRQMALWKKYRQEISRFDKLVRDEQGKGERIDSKEAKDRDKKAAGAARDAASSSQSYANVLKKKMEVLSEVEKPFEEEPFILEVHPKTTDGDLEVTAEDLVAGHTKEGLVGPVSLSFHLGDRICFMGANGVGKSTLLKTIIGEIKPVSGTITISDGITFGDLMQQQERADRSVGVLDFFTSQTGQGEEKAIHMLKKHGLEEQVFNQKVGGLSAGIRARLLLAVFSAKGVNVLILDEPTNHLDIGAAKALKDLLGAYRGIVILVSHNRWFLEDLEIGKFYEIEDREVKKIDSLEKYIEEAESVAQKILRRLRHLV